MKKTILLFFITAILCAQYTPNDKELVKTTFLREFDPVIIDSYLSSNDSAKINAALLSIAQSGDTSFAAAITQIDFAKHGKLISFVLGEIGPCKTSQNYLTEKLEAADSKYSSELFEAIGKIGNENNLQECIELYKKNKSSGFPLAVFNFHSRSVIDSSKNDIKILIENLSNHKNDKQLFNSLFALYRISAQDVNPEDLKKIIMNDFDSSIKTYALGILRRQNSFPFAISVASLLAEDKYWSVRTEAARTICYFPFSTKEELSVFTGLLSDNNPSVARTAAQALTNLNLQTDSLKQALINELHFMVVNDDIHENTRGEILLALQQWQPERTRDLYLEFKCMVSPIYIYQLLGNSEDESTAFVLLKQLYDISNSYERFFIFSNIANFYDSLKTDQNFAKFIIDRYNSNSPQIVTLNNFIIDSSFAVNNRLKLKKKIEKLVSDKLLEEDFNQAISTLGNVTNLIDTSLTKDIVEFVRDADNYDLQYDLRNQIDLSKAAQNHREELFEMLFEKSFSYEKAVVKTARGNYTIEFTPEVAPISVGNFIYLAESNFYSNILYHRVVPNFVIQSGDPSGTGWSGPAYTIVSEFSPSPFDTYYVGMASAGKDTEGSQWFVMNNHYPHLNGNYTNFGKVISGFDVVDFTDQYDMIYYIAPIN